MSAPGPGRPVTEWDWRTIERDLDAHGVARTGPILDADTCRAVAALYDRPELFRSTVIMERHGFGRGAYKYFTYPLPDVVDGLRHAAYPHLAPIADRWHRDLGIDRSFPDALDGFLDQCHGAGQTRPTPLLLRYKSGDFNCLHQDLYGEVYFPFQMAVLLDRPGADFTGGAFTVVEQRPRRQSRAEVVDLAQGEAVIFAVRERPVTGARGPYRVMLRHGVSRVLSGRRHTLGVIFHDAV